MKKVVKEFLKTKNIKNYKIKVIEPGKIQVSYDEGSLTAYSPEHCLNQIAEMMFRDFYQDDLFLDYFFNGSFLEEVIKEIKSPHFNGSILTLNPQVKDRQKEIIKKVLSLKPLGDKAPTKSIASKVWKVLDEIYDNQKDVAYHMAYVLTQQEAKNLAEEALGLSLVDIPNSKEIPWIGVS